MPFEYDFDDLESDKEKLELKEWKKKNGYILCQHLPGGSLITIIRKWAWDEFVDENYWSVDGYLDKDALYFRIFGLEATLIYPLWFAKFLKSLRGENENY